MLPSHSLKVSYTDTLHIVSFPGGSAGKESACNAGDPSSIPVLERFPGEGKGYPLQYSWASLVAQLVKNLPVMQETAGSGRSVGEGIGYPLRYSGLENSVDCRVHGVTKSWTQLSNFHFHTVKTVPTSLSGPKALICSNL